MALIRLTKWPCIQVLFILFFLNQSTYLYGLTTNFALHLHLYCVRLCLAGHVTYSCWPNHIVCISVAGCKRRVNSHAILDYWQVFVVINWLINLEHSFQRWTTGLVISLKYATTNSDPIWDRHPQLRLCINQKQQRSCLNSCLYNLYS